MKTVIMAGGRGTRIAEIFPETPKPLIPIDGVPVLEREINLLKEQGFDDIIITVAYQAQKIIDYFGDGSQHGVKIEYFVEHTPLGNAGALLKLRSKLTNPFLLINADVLFDIDLRRMIEFHNFNDALVTLFTHPNSHPYDSGLLEADDSGRIMKWFNKEDERPQFYKNRVNAGIHIINPKVLESVEIKKNQKTDLDRDLLKPLVGTGKMFCYDSPEYVKDMGTPKRFLAVERDLKLGIPHSKNLANKQKAVFLDRDGTINVYKGFVRSTDAFELLPGVAEAIKIINESGFLAIVITNQPVVARGEVSINELNQIHNKMETLLGENGAYVDGVFYCPHHPDKGYNGEIPELKISCECRKPKPGLILKAARQFNINLEESWMVGDSQRDVQAGKRAGCKTALISEENKLFGQNVTVNSLIDFVLNYDKGEKIK